VQSHYVSRGLYSRQVYAVTLAITENNEYLSFFSSGPDAVHFRGYSRHGVGHVRVDESGVLEDTF
jgi:hypothetical protein